MHMVILFCSSYLVSGNSPFIHALYPVTSVVVYGLNFLIDTFTYSARTIRSEICTPFPDRFSADTVYTCTIVYCMGHRYSQYNARVISPQSLALARSRNSYRKSDQLFFVFDYMSSRLLSKIKILQQPHKFIFDGRSYLTTRHRLDPNACAL